MEKSEYIENTNKDVKNKSKYINYYNFKRGLNVSDLKKTTKL